MVYLECFSNILNFLNTNEEKEEMGVTAVCIFRSGKCILNKNPVSGYIARKMSSDWKTTKENYLDMPLEDKRSGYKCGSNYKTYDQLPTWAEYYRTKLPLAEKIPILGGFVVDDSKNTELAKKISVFEGDIVTLEVRGNCHSISRVTIFFVFTKYDNRYYSSILI